MIIRNLLRNAIAVTEQGNIDIEMTQNEMKVQGYLLSPIWMDMDLAY